MGSSHRRRQISRRRARGRVTSLAVLAVLAPGSALASPSFEGLGHLDPAQPDSLAEAVSADGNVVVGSSLSASGQEGFVWTPGSGLTALGDLSGGDVFSTATGVSADGTVIVGTGTTASDASRAWRSVSPFTSLSALGNFSCGVLCPDIAVGSGVSPDGDIVVGAGTDRPLFGDPFVEAARWVAGSFGIDGLGHLSGGGVASAALDATSSGLVVGDSDSSDGTEAFLWDGSIGPLPDLVSTRPGSSATAISTDGSVIVGYANTETDPLLPANAEPVYWTESNPGISGFDTITEIGRLPGATVAGGRALAVSDSGQVIVGVANDATAMDVAFIWDATSGIRDLRQVLEDDYGLDLTGWILDRATGISDVDPSGTVVVVGAGTNPDGNPEAWRAVLSPTECNDGADNDNDGQADFPADPECIARGDLSETPDCGDGLDNDGDGQTDFPSDPECRSASDLSEVPDCSDGFDGDGDGQIDHPADPGCRRPDSPREDPACDDGLDNDGDGNTDHPADPDCLAADDFSEVRDCVDGLDNDGDGLTDFPADPDCSAAQDYAEDAACDDRIDNDGDGRRDWPEAIPACTSAADTSEAPQCADDEDNDGDGQIDWPLDGECQGEGGLLEDPPVLAVGDLLAVSRTGNRLFRIDPSSGAQTLVSEGGQWVGPEGVAVRSTGEIVVADPTGLSVVDAESGTQRRFADPLSANESLQVAFDAEGDAVVLHVGGLTEVAWVWSGIGATTTLLAVPTPGEPADVIGWVGDSMLRESSGDWVVGAIGGIGDGVFRLDGSTFAATALTGGFTFAKWFDLALEPSGDILAVGDDFPLATGVFRIDPTDGSRTPLSTGAPWVEPVAVARSAAGDVFVSDAGTCDAEGLCTGSEVVRVDPVSGARLDVWSGGFIDGPLDLAVVTSLPVCSDGVDNDGDGQTDYPADDGCTAPGDPSELIECGDGIDNDADGAVDLVDLGCEGAIATARENPASQCNDGLDNDFDGAVDWDGGPGGGPTDPQCALKPWGRIEKKSRKCGLGGEWGLVLAGALAAHRRRRRQGSAPAGR